MKNSATPPGAQARAPEQRQGRIVGLGLRLAAERGRDQGLARQADDAAAQVAQHDAEEKGQAERLDDPLGAVAVRDVAHLVGQHPGHLVGRLGEVDQAAQDDDAPAGQGDGVDDLAVEHRDPERVGRGGDLRQPGAQPVERAPPGVRLADPGPLAVRDGEQGDDLLEHTLAQRHLPGNRDHPGGRRGEARQREPQDTG